jgi:hypothetical protein
MSGEDSYIIGMISIMITMLIVILLETILQPHNNRKIIEDLSSRVNFMTHKISDKLSLTGELIKILKYGHIRIPPGKSTEVWMELLWSMKKKYWGVIYISPKECAQSSIFENSISIMTAKNKVGMLDVRRVFLLDNEMEYPEIAECIRLCQENEIQTRIIYKKDLDTIHILNDKTIHIKTLDFIIIDDEIIWQTILDNNRFEKYSEIYFDSNMNETFSDVFKQIWDTASSCKYIPKISRSLQ